LECNSVPSTPFDQGKIAKKGGAKKCWAETRAGGERTRPGEICRERKRSWQKGPDIVFEESKALIKNGGLKRWREVKNKRRQTLFKRKR